MRQNEVLGNALMATLAYEHVSEVVTGFGEKGVSAERVAGALVNEVRAYRESEGALGPHLADQWLLPLALAVVARGGAAPFTCTEMTEHATTNIGVIEKFLPLSFDVQTSGACSRVRVIAAANAKTMTVWACDPPPARERRQPLTGSSRSGRAGASAAGPWPG